MTREAVTAFATEHVVPVENVLSPDPLRRVIWAPPADRSAAGFTAALEALGARRWQTQIVAPMIAAAFEAHPDAVAGSGTGADGGTDRGTDRGTDGDTRTA
jgi:ribonuclease D